jgi:hypothetical protein
MRLDPPFTPTVSGVDPSGMPIITRNPLAYTRTATGFTQAMASAQQNVSSKPPITSLRLVSLLPESSAAPWNVNVQAGQTLSGIVRDQMAARASIFPVAKLCACRKPWHRPTKCPMPT